jgi:hypothetical protein
MAYIISPTLPSPFTTTLLNFEAKDRSSRKILWPGSIDFRMGLTPYCMIIRTSKEMIQGSGSCLRYLRLLAASCPY